MRVRCLPARLGKLSRGCIRHCPPCDPQAPAGLAPRFPPPARREKLGGRIAKLETQLAAASERAERAEQQLASRQEEMEEEVRRVRMEAAAALAAVRQVAAAAKERTEQESAR